MIFNDPFSCSYSDLYNLVYNDRCTEDAVLEDVKLYKEFGGGTIVENSNYGLQRNIPFMRKVSETTGINIIAGTGKIFSRFIKTRSVNLAIY